MFARTAITLTLLFFAGAAVAEWQSKPQAAAASSNRLQETSQQTASGLVQASLTQGTNSIEPADAKTGHGRRLRRLSARATNRCGKAISLAPVSLTRKPSPSEMPPPRWSWAAPTIRSTLREFAGRNAEPEPAKAFEWYRRAMDAGAAQTAMVRIDDLKRFVSR